MRISSRSLPQRTAHFSDGTGRVSRSGSPLAPRSAHTTLQKTRNRLSVSLVRATRTDLPLVGATGRDDLWRWQVSNCRNAFGGIGSICTRTEHGFVLSVQMLGPELYDKCPSGAIPKPGKDAIVSLKAGQLAWIETRNRQCTETRGESILVDLDCATRTTVERTQFLTDRQRECLSTGCVNSKLR